MRNMRRSGQILRSKKYPRPTGESGRGRQTNSNIFRQVLAWVTETGERLDALVGLAALGSFSFVWRSQSLRSWHGGSAIIADSVVAGWPISPGHWPVTNRNDV